jgi:hypothetical protein
MWAWGGWIPPLSLLVRGGGRRAGGGVRGGANLGDGLIDATPQFRLAGAHGAAWEGRTDCGAAADLEVVSCCGPRSADAHWYLVHRRCSRYGVRVQ